MLFALEAQLGREFRTTFAKARGELGDTADSAESFGSRATQAVDAVSSVLAAAGISAALKEIKEGFDECVQASMDFESAITGVAKTTDLTDEELADMSDAIKAMSTEIPASTTEIAAVAEAAGQLGIQKDALLDFTRVMTMLGTATNMTAEDAATALARFANITGMSADNYDRLGAVIVDLGNNFATTESEITQMGTRLASGGKLAGLTEPQIMALAAAMSSVGIEAEAGGTAMTQTLNAIEKAVATGEDSLQSFADVAGMSADSFAEMWNTDALGALTAFIRGLGNLDEQGESAVLVLEDLGLTGIRQSNMLKSLALAADQMDSAVQTANTAWDENIALTNEANKRYATTQSKLDMMQNAYNNLKVAVGDAFTPALRDAYDAGTDVLNVLPDVLRQDEKMLALATGVAEILTARPAEIEQNMLYQHIDTLPEDLLDQLAHDFGVSWWDNDWDIEQKRATFRESWHVRRHLGTKYAVELALSTSFGSGKVQEWFEYGGEPNHYRIFDVDIRQVNDNIRTFLQILEVVSRKSAVLDSIRAISVRELILYFGAVMSVTKKFKLTTGEVNTDIDIMGDEAGNALCDWDGGLIMMDKEATV